MKLYLDTIKEKDIQLVGSAASLVAQKLFSMIYL
jgi:hypothetical protein